MTLKLWGRPSSARTQKVLLALAELGLKYDMVFASATMGPGGSVENGNEAYGVVDTPEYRAMNPNGTVPTLKDGDFVLWESNAIVQYLGMAYDPIRFYGGDPQTFASASRWMMFENNQIIQPMHTYVRHTIRLPDAKRDAGLAAECKARLDVEFAKIETQLARTRFIAGDGWSMGDFPLTIRVHRWHLLGLARPEMANVARYYADLKARPAFQAIADPAMHVSG